MDWLANIFSKLNSSFSKKFATLFSLLLFGWFYVISVSAIASDVKIRIGYNSSASFPHILGKGTLPANPPGLSVEIINHIATELDIEIEFVRMPGLRVLNTLKTDNLDAAFLFSYKKEREEFGAYPMVDGILDDSKRLSTLTYALYRPKGSALSWNGESLTYSKLPVGANIGYSIVDFLRQKGVEVEEAKDTAVNIRKLRHGRLSAIADQVVVVDSFLRMNNIVDVERISPPLISKPYFLIFSHGFISEHPKISQKIWQLIADKREMLTRKLTSKYLKLTCPC